jgi:hypothetical protein
MLADVATKLGDKRQGEWAREAERTAEQDARKVPLHSRCETEP